MFPSFSTFSQQYKKLNRGDGILSHTFSFILAKTQKSNWNNFYDVFIQISGKYRSILHRETHLHVQKNYIQSCGFGFNKTRLLHRGNDEQYQLPINSSSTPKIFSQFFIANLSKISNILRFFAD